MQDDDDEDTVISPLCQSIERDGSMVEVHIYRSSEETTWVLEIVDFQGTVTSWDDRFHTDHAALMEALSAIDLEGIGAFLTVEEPDRLN